MPNQVGRRSTQALELALASTPHDYQIDAAVSTERAGCAVAPITAISIITA